MAKIKPILFNTEMARATLENRKAVTRRAPFQTEGDFTILKGTYFDPDDRLCALFHKLDNRFSCMPFYAPYQPGDILYVRETWAESADGYVYRADNPDSDGWGWRPSIHMPREAARIFLRVTDVRVERLRDITEEQAQAEGLYRGWALTETSSVASTAKQAFMWVWDSTVSASDKM